MTELTKAEVTEAEHQVDAAMKSVTLPAETRDKCRWHLLTVSEDHVRLHALGKLMRDDVVGEVLGLSDRNKYALKHCLPLADGRAPMPLDHSPAIDDDAYGKAKICLEVGRAYDAAVAGFGGYHAGLTRAMRRTDGAIYFQGTQVDARLLGLDRLEAATHVERAPLETFLGWLRKDELPAGLDSIVQSVRAAGAARVKYRFDDNLANRLVDYLPTVRNFIPPGWSCHLGDVQRIASLLAGLMLCSIYHWLIYTFGVAQSGTDGAGVNSLLDILTLDNLSKRLSGLCRESASAVREILHQLTYGNQVQSPDPALQFLIPLNSGMIAVPWVMLATCNLQRNFLTLFARTDAAEFNAQSHLFEAHMIERLKPLVSELPYSARYNRPLPVQNTAGEVDVLLVDEQSQCILVVELQWTLPPGEVRETRNREDAAREKVEQARRKRDAARTALPALLHALTVKAPPDAWRVEGVVAIENFVPALTPRSDIPVVTFRTLLAALRRQANLQSAADWLLSEDWLPSPEHFTIAPEDTAMGGVRFAVEGIAFNESGVRWIVERDTDIFPYACPGVTLVDISDMEG